MYEFLKRNRLLMNITIFYALELCSQGYIQLNGMGLGLE